MPSAPRLVDPPPPASASRPWVLYVDMDAFYVNCELLSRPELRGVPVIVGHRPTTATSRAVVLSASYEAREFGVRSALPVGEAVRRCPDASWIAPDFALYERVSRDVRDWLTERFGAVSPHSIDEASVVVEAPDTREAVSLARAGQAALQQALRLPSSWGVASSRLIAKIASDEAKPGGVVGVDPAKIAEFLAPLPVRSIPGIGPKTADILRRAGVERVSDLAERRPAEMRELLGAWGTTLVAIARGNPPPDPDETPGPRSRSTDRTFDTDRSDREGLEAETERLAEELAGSLQREGLAYGGVGVALRWEDFERVQRSHALPGVVTGAPALATHARRLLRELLQEEHVGRDRAVRTVTVRAERVTPARGAQSSLDGY